jgi:hypothetical protein
MADYSAMKSYLEGNNLHYFTFSPNSENPIKVVTVTFPQTRQRKIIPTTLGTSLQRQDVAMAATRTAPNGQAHVETLSLFLVTLTRNTNIKRYPNGIA